MQRFGHLASAFVLAISTAAAQTTTWVPDKVHSEIDFSILHMSLSKVHGRLGNIRGAIVLNDADISKSSVNMTIDVTSIDTGVSARDADLKGTDFFDVAQFPTATFVSTSVSKGDSGFTVAGNLTLRGVTKPVVLQVDDPTGPIAGMDKKPHAGYSATTTIDRTAFGIGSKYPPAMLGDEVKLSIELEVARQ